MSDVKSALLVVEDDVDIADMLAAYFRVQGYDVRVAEAGEAALQAARAHHPDLVILDIRLPDMDGYEVARRLRSSRRTESIPIIFLTERRERNDRLKGLALGADDYITKPFDIQELRLRVRNSLRRSSSPTLTNPVTGLAEGALVDERLLECLGSQGWAVLLISLQNLDAFREAYGFVASDDVQRAISLMIHNAVLGVGAASDFVGQFTPTEFILVTTPASLPGLAARIRGRLEQSLDYFYPVRDRDQSNVSAKRLRVQLAQLTDSEGSFQSLQQIKEELERRRG